MKTLQTVPDELMPIVASAGSPTYFEPTMDVGGAPLHVPAKRLQVALAEKTYPLARSAAFYSLAKWDTIAEFLETQTDGITFEANGRRSNSLIAGNADALVVVELDYRADWTVTIAAKDRPTANKWMDALGALLPETPPPPPPDPLPYNVIPVRFWMQNPSTGSAYSRRRNITVTDWTDIEGNYAASVRDDLAKLATMDTAAGGKLILLHGPPGSGKTRLLLSLMSQWRDWCSASVVTDTDRFFNDPTYCNSLIFESDGSRDWMMLVLEDADEFIAISSKANKGQAISRLLNLADGIVGQGLNLLTIMTTNVAVDELNPAVIRPGRCLANIQVGPLPVAEANQWLADKGSSVTVEQDSTLATLYATLNAQ